MRAPPTGGRDSILVAVSFSNCHRFNKQNNPLNRYLSSSLPRSCFALLAADLRWTLATLSPGSLTLPICKMGVGGPSPPRTVVS